MNLDDFIIACCCLIDDCLPVVLKGKRVRPRGPTPKLSDSEVLTMEVVGIYLGITQYKALPQLHRTTFVRQAAHLWALKERLWCHLRDAVIWYDPMVVSVDSLPLPVCRFTRSSRRRRFADMATYGKDHSGKQTSYSFQLHLRLCWPGLITQSFLAPVLTEGTGGLALGDRNSWVPRIQEELRCTAIILLAPYRRASSPKSKATESQVLGRVRYLVDTVFGQLTDRCSLKRIWASELCHLRNRLLRAFLMHSIGFLFNQQDEAPVLQLERLVA